MKAREKNTGKEITILGISKEWGTATYIEDGILHQERLSSGEWEIIDESEPVDWSFFRREVAKDILPTMINWRRTNGAGANILISKEEAVKLAIEYADELIKQLKDEK